MAQRALRATPDRGATKTRLMATLNLARTNFLLTNIEASQEAALAALDMALKLGDRRAETMAFNQLANNATMGGDEETARQIYEKILAIGEELGDDLLMARGHYGLMLRARKRRDLEEWDRRLIESDGAMRKCKEWVYVYWIESYRGTWHEAKGDIPSAAKSYASCLGKMMGMSVVQGVVWQWEFIAGLCHRTGDDELAASLLGAADGHRQRARWPLQLDEVERVRTLQQAVRGALGERYEELFAKGTRTTLMEATERSLEAAQRISESPPPFGS